jgi:AcrR family transcriptional regulator
MALRTQKKAEESPVGRPRSFDVDRALDQALQVFRRKGYEGASLSDLTEAMGINRPSLYAAFGDKETLFRKALDRYGMMVQCMMDEALKKKTARAVVESFLREAIEMQTHPGSPPGCLTVHGALACGDESESIRKELTCRRDQAEAAIRERFKRAKKERDLPADCNPADLARYVATVMQGMAVQAAGGATRSELQRVVNTVLRAWPGH